MFRKVVFLNFLSQLLDDEKYVVPDAILRVVGTVDIASKTFPGHPSHGRREHKAII